jgi:hypothetical protein
MFYCAVTNFSLILWSICQNTNVIRKLSYFMKDPIQEYFLIGILFIILLVFSTVILFYPTQKSFAAIYKNSEYTIYYPAGWTVNGGNQRHVLFLSPNLHQNSASYRSPQLYVGVSDSNGLSLLPFMVNSNIKNFSSGFKDFKLQSKTPFTFEGNTGYQIVYTYKHPNFGKVQEMRVWLIGGGKYYDIAFNAKTSDYGHYLPTAQTMINSFGILTPGVGTHQVSSYCQGLNTFNTFVPLVGLAGPHAAAGALIAGTVGQYLSTTQCK